MLSLKTLQRMDLQVENPAGMIRERLKEIFYAYIVIEFD